MFGRNMREDHFLFSVHLLLFSRFLSSFTDNCCCSPNVLQKNSLFSRCLFFSDPSRVLKRDDSQLDSQPRMPHLKHTHTQLPLNAGKGYIIDGQVMQDHASVLCGVKS